MILTISTASTFCAERMEKLSEPICKPSGLDELLKSDIFDGHGKVMGLIEKKFIKSVYKFISVRSVFICDWKRYIVNESFLHFNVLFAATTQKTLFQSDYFTSFL